MQAPAEQLQGRKLDQGWTVSERIERRAKATGGTFSVGYVLESPEHGRAYLKALDFSAALKSDDPSTALQAMTAAYNFERDLCRLCRERRLSRVVRAIDDGRLVVDPANPATVVQYLVFELADGDIRSQLDSIDRFDTAWALRSLHHIATGLQQLHTVGVAHQDLKPSNVLVFQNVSKVADLGRAATRGSLGPFDRLPVAGDASYAPPELLYGWQDADWSRRRLGCDAYLLGSMVVFFFARVSMTPLVLSELHADHHWKNWGGDFAEILPYLRDAFGRALHKFVCDVPTELSTELVQLVRELCEPDPTRRGFPQDVGNSSQFSLHRYISRFDRLASRSEYNLWRR